VGMNAWVPAIAMGITVFHALGMGVGSVVLNASRLAPALPLGGGVVLAIAAAFLTWWLLPREASASTGVEAADMLPIRPGEVAGWTGKVDLPAWFVSLIAAVAAALATAQHPRRIFREGGSRPDRPHGRLRRLGNPMGNRPEP
jgi:hypothetical protein